jgi:deoxyribonuclease V
MHVALDVGYHNQGALAACVGFLNWTDAEATLNVTEQIPQVEEYVPGQFYQRELPCLLAVLKKLDDTPETIIIDGQVHLDDTAKPGLGMYLFKALNQQVPVIGVAKSSFRGLTKAIEVYRGESERPLFVTAAGMSYRDAADRIQQMHGDYRLPTLLKLVDQLSKEQEDEPG